MLAFSSWVLGNWAETAVESCLGVNHTSPYQLADKEQTSSNELLPLPAPLELIISLTFVLTLPLHVCRCRYVPLTDTHTHYHTPTKSHRTTRHFFKTHRSQVRDGPRTAPASVPISSRLPPQHDAHRLRSHCHCKRKLKHACARCINKRVGPHSCWFELTLPTPFLLVILRNHLAFRHPLFSVICSLGKWSSHTGFNVSQGYLLSSAHLVTPRPAPKLLLSTSTACHLSS